MRSALQGLVKQINSNVYTVDLETKEYSSKIFQENGIPYGHAITAIFAHPERDLIPFMPEILSIATWKRTYSDNFPLIDITKLQPLPLSECHPPLTRVPRGRPKKERYRKEDIRRPRGAGAAGNWRNQWGMATTRYGGPTTVQPVAEEDTSQALIEGLINENISSKSFDLSNGIGIFIMVSESLLWYRNLYYGIGIFIMVSKSFMPKSMVSESLLWYRNLLCPKVWY